MRSLFATALLATGCLLFPVDDVVRVEHPTCHEIHPGAVNVAKWRTRTVVEPFESREAACVVEECVGTFVDANHDPADGCEAEAQEGGLDGSQ